MAISKSQKYSIVDQKIQHSQYFYGAMLLLIRKVIGQRISFHVDQLKHPRPMRRLMEVMSYALRKVGKMYE